ncbi:MAG: TIGR02688 family protein [Candidatus Altiarchaeales archaeon WOR_SM1_79]|nr:MAG: TIGR02688 family protein [Candidatus Altiarchaeales archaeon WOR_SM1_79]
MEEQNLNQKLKEVYPTAVVDKSLVLQQEVRGLPRFVSEWLISKFCKDGVTEENLQKMNEFIRKHYPERKEKDKVLASLMTFGKYHLIDEFKVETDIDLAIYKLNIPSLDIRNAHIDDYIVMEHDRLLVDGVWGVGVLRYGEDNEVIMADFKPLQLSTLNFDAFAEGRSQFTTDEWVDVLINSIGLNPDVYDSNTKLILLSRMIPLVEPNVNMIELGPKGTGKTYLFRNSSYYSRIVSGGQITPATLFYHLVTKTPGLLAVSDCIVLDEVSAIKLAHPEEMLGKLKDYMESGNYDRGHKKVQSQTSVILVGNLPVKDNKPLKTLYFEVLPKIMQDTAFLDRLNGFIPGWELIRIQKSSTHLTTNFGFAADYLCEILHELRKIDFQTYITQCIQFNDAVDIRDEKSVKKVASGMLKILFPDGKFTTDELKLCMDLAVDYRQRIIDQLNLMATGEFKKKQLGYEIIKC